jgi:hypothetical protein
MLQGPVFLASFAGAWHFHTATDQETDVEFMYSFTTRWRRLRPVLDPLIVVVFGRDVRKRLKALKNAIARGEIAVAPRN